MLQLGEEISDGAVENVNSNGDREDRVDEVDAGELHDDGANEDGEPRESIFEHVEIDGFLIKTFAFHSGEGGE